MKKALFTLAVAPFAAVAYFDGTAVVQPVTAKPAPGYEVIADRTVTPLKSIGRPVPEVAALEAGYSNGVPLETGLKQLLPPGWTGYIRPSLPRGMNVLWIQGSTWIQALEQISQQGRFAMVLDWDRKVVTVDPLPPESDLASGPAGVKAPSSTLVPGPNGELIYMTPRASDPSSPLNSPVASMPLVAGGVSYKTLDDFLNETVQVDLRGVSFRDLLVALLPPDWEADIPEADSQIDKLRVDMTDVASRGEILHGLATRTGMSIFPYLELRKIVVTKVGG